VVTEMVRLARPGGWIASLEPDVEHSLCYPPHPAWTRVIEIFRTAFSRNGADLFIGRRLMELYCAAGLADIGVEARVGVYRAGDSRRTVLVDLVRSLRPVILALAISDERELAELDRTVREHLDDPRTLVIPHLSILAWGGKPALHGPAEEAGQPVNRRRARRHRHRGSERGAQPPRLCSQSLLRGRDRPFRDVPGEVSPLPGGPGQVPSVAQVLDDPDPHKFRSGNWTERQRVHPREHARPCHRPAQFSRGSPERRERVVAEVVGVAIGSRRVVDHRGEVQVPRDEVVDKGPCVDSGAGRRRRPLVVANAGDDDLRARDRAVHIRKR
jgi:hypothetical protein